MAIGFSWDVLMHHDMEYVIGMGGLLRVSV